MRDTYINDSDLQCFNVLTKLKELYLECPKKEKPPESSSDDDTDDDFENIQNRFIATYRDRTENPSESDAPGGSVPGSSTVIVAAPMAEASGSSARLSVSLPVPEIQITHGDPNDNPVAVNSDNEQPIPSTSRAANTDSSTDSSMSDSSTSAEDMESNSAFSAIVIRNYQNGNNANNGSRNSVNSPNNLLNQNNEPRMEPRMHISINNNFRIRDLAVPRLMPLEVPAIRLMMVGENNYPHARYKLMNLHENLGTIYDFFQIPPIWTRSSPIPTSEFAKRQGHPWFWYSSPPDSARRCLHPHPAKRPQYLH